MLLLIVNEGSFPEKDDFLASTVSAITLAMKSQIAHFVTLSRVFFVLSISSKGFSNNLGCRYLHCVQRCGSQSPET